ncbi:MAG: YihY/virulence factor BrkB family protein [Bacteroidales bacterium]|nr:YihY/virulence factor BrkB family protein [Bacteroidales bacterium]
MSYIAGIQRYFHRLHIRTRFWLRKVVLPGFGGVPLYDVLVFFFRGLYNGVITYRAAAIAFNFFLALIPFILFLFTLIPFMTSDHYQVYLLDLVSEVMPSNIFQMVKSTVVEVISRQHQGLLSIVFFTAIYFATNGVNAIIEGFNQSYHRPETRPWWKQFLVAFLLMLILTLLTFVSFSLLGFGEYLIRGLINHELIASSWAILLLQSLRWFIILLTTMLSVSILFYFGQLKTLKSIKYMFITVGSVSTTALFMVGGLMLKLYFENFSRYNLLYGSIGSLIILMVWVYYNSLMILVGFELDYSIKISQEHKMVQKQIQGE